MRSELDKLMRAAADNTRIISFGGGLPATESFPRAGLARAASEAVADLAHDPLQYHFPEGREQLREWVAARMQQRGARVSADDIVLTNGAQDALALAIDVLRPAQIATDEVAYPAALELFRGRKCQLVARASVRYATPAISNPQGLRGLFQEDGAEWIIEDDAYADLDFEGPAKKPLLTTVRARVLHVGTLSKTLSPGLRVGWLIAPPALRKNVRERYSERDLHAGTLSQAIAERYLAHTDFDARLTRLRTHYQLRAERLARALRKAGVRFTAPDGGFSVWAELDTDLPDVELLRRAVKHGVSWDPGTLFFREANQQRTRKARLSFSLVDPDKIEEGVQRLVKVTKGVRSTARV